VPWVNHGLGMSTAAECRQNAAECIRLAKLARSVEQKNILCEMAQTWEDLAQAAERLEKTETKNKKPNAA
jgi:Asp-tRNA(Asn)/Glu-tRNA(Gln) amidotransferase C subunit